MISLNETDLPLYPRIWKTLHMQGIKYRVAWTSKIENTLVHSHLVNFASDDYACKIANNRKKIVLVLTK